MSPVSIGIQMGQSCPPPQCPLAREGLRAVRPQGWATAGGGTNRVAEPAELLLQSGTIVTTLVGLASADGDTVCRLANW